MRTLTAVLAAAILAGLAASAARATTDPRVCSGTPAAHHAYWCAKNAAGTAARTAMARNQNTAHWYAPTFCSAIRGNILHWSCDTFIGGHRWKVTVSWRATKAGWRQAVAIVKIA